MIIWRESLFALIYSGDWVTWKVLAEYSWSPTTARSGSFLCTAASSTPIRVVTRASGRFLGCAQRYCTYGPRALNGPSWAGKRSELGRALQLG